MGGTVYSSISRAAYEDKVSYKSVNEIFTQNNVRKIHQEMNPMNLGIREARDSKAHPTSFPIIIALDVTGSMGHIPERIVRKELSTIMSSLLDAGLEHPQIMFLAIGDHTCDKAPLQVGQFESGDQELAKWLESTWLERGGGGGDTESYPLAWLVAGRHTSTDAFEKRGQKGVLITIGDEKFHDEYNPSNITGESVQGRGYSSEQLLKMAKEKWSVFHIHANYTSHRNDNHVINVWKDLLGQRLRMANNDAEVALRIVECVKECTKKIVAKSNVEESAPNTDKEEEIL